MPRLVRLTGPGGEPIWINPERVEAVTAWSLRHRTAVFLTGRQLPIIVETDDPEGVARELGQ